MRQMNLRVAKLCALAVALLLGIGVSWAAPKKSPASDNNIIGMITRGFDKVERNPAIFDGRAVPPTANIREAHVLLSQMKHGIEVFEGNWQNLSDDALASAEFKALKAKYDDLRPYYVAFGPALDLREKQNAQADADAKAKQQADRQAQQAEYERKRAAEAADQQHRDDVCNGFWGKFSDRNAAKEVVGALGSVPWDEKEVTAKKALLEKGAAVCKAPEYADIGALRDVCKDKGKYSVENAYPADVCEATTHLEGTLRAGIAARMEREVAFKQVPTVEGFRVKEGYIDTLEPFLFDRNLAFGDAMKTTLTEKYAPLFAAAGIPVDDAAFAPIKAYYDNYRAVVEATANEWTTPGQKCKGGIITKVCNMAKKDVLAWHKKAKILKVTTDTVVFVKGSEASLDGWVLYQVPGEKYCQLRAWTVNEDGGRHLATTLQYVRVQQCK